MSERNHNQETMTFYKAIIELVVENSRQEFVNEGVSEDVLNQMKNLWLEKTTSIMKENQQKALESRENNSHNQMHHRMQHNI